jgi:hypothetical protein
VTKPMRPKTRGCWSSRDPVIARTLVYLLLLVLTLLRLLPMTPFWFLHL